MMNYSYSYFTSLRSGRIATTATPTAVPIKVPVVEKAIVEECSLFL
jgi:hypothetical protein